MSVSYTHLDVYKRQAKALPGFLAFGPEFAHTPKLCHQANEYITQKDLLDAAKIYSRAIYALAR